MLTHINTHSNILDMINNFGDKMKATEALEKFDNNISAMARGLEVSRQTVYNWVNNNDQLPKLRQIQLEYYFKNK